MSDDVVNHPSHYTEIVPGVECIDVAQHFNFNRGNAIKYLWRAGAKGDAVEDLRKAIKYCEFEIARLEAERDAMRTEVITGLGGVIAGPPATINAPATINDAPVDSNVVQFPPPGQRWHE